MSVSVLVYGINLISEVPSRFEILENTHSYGQRVWEAWATRAGQGRTGQDRAGRGGGVGVGVCVCDRPHEELAPRISLIATEYPAIATAALPVPPPPPRPCSTHPRLLRDFWNLNGFLYIRMFIALYIRKSLYISNPAARLLIISIFPPPVKGIAGRGWGGDTYEGETCLGSIQLSVAKVN